MRLASEAKILIEDWNRIQMHVRREESELQGRFSIGCHEAVGLFSLQRFVPELLSQNPGIELTIPHSYSRFVTEDIISYRLDFGIVVNPVKHPDLIIRPLYEDDVCLWIAKNADKPSVLVYDPSTIEVNPILDQMEKTGMKFARIISVGSMETAASLVAAKVGVGILPGQVAIRYSDGPLLPYGPNKKVGVRVNVCLAYRFETQKTRAGQHIAKLIEQRLTGISTQLRKRN